MATNSILQFGATSVNILSDAAYTADAQRPAGVQPGIARDTLHNKTLLQVSTIAAAVAEVIAGSQATDVTDALTPAALAGMLRTAMQQLPIGAVTGTADALIGTFAPVTTARITGAPLIVRAVSANATAASTFQQDAQTAKTIVKGNNLPLVAGDIAGAGHWLQLQWDVTLDKYVLLNPARGVTPGALIGGQARLSLVGANLTLLPFNGNQIPINGSLVAVPSAGVTLAATGAAVSTLYYIYAYMAGSVMTLERSTTGHSTDATTGVEIKTGDATRTLVGMARTHLGGLWTDDPVQRFVRSWFNREGVGGAAFLTSTTNTSATGYVELSAFMRIEFVLWSGELVSCSHSGEAYCSSSNQEMRTTFAFNGIVPEDGNAQCQSGFANIGYNLSSGLQKSGLTEGYNYVTLVVSVTAGTVYFTGDNITINRNNIQVRIGG